MPKNVGRQKVTTRTLFHTEYITVQVYFTAWLIPWHERKTLFHSLKLVRLWWDGSLTSGFLKWNVLFFTFIAAILSCRKTYVSEFTRQNCALKLFTKFFMTTIPALQPMLWKGIFSPIVQGESISHVSELKCLFFCQAWMFGEDKSSPPKGFFVGVSIAKFPSHTFILHYTITLS